MGDFADYPAADSVFYELSFFRCKLPLPLDTNKYSLRISGNNHSDDLFMFIKKKISGLPPNTDYDIRIDVNLASKYPTNLTGIGGSPGEDVTIKAGASLIEPKKINQIGYYRMNIDKGNQSISGIDMDTVGNAGVTDTTTVYTLIDRNNKTHLFRITTDSNGEVWICIGTDSGFEGTTTLYFNIIILLFTKITGIGDTKNLTNKYSISQNYPNPFNPSTRIKYSVSQFSHTTISVFDILSHKVATLLDEEKPPGTYEITWNASSLPSGVYFYQIRAGYFVETKKMILLK